MRECGNSKPQVETNMVVLMDSEDEDKNNLCFLQELKQVTTSTSQLIAKFSLLIVQSFSNFSSSKFE
jgi:hypothetical protein